MFFDTILCSGLELVQNPTRLRHADHGHIQVPAFRHRMQSGKDLLVRQVTGRTEEYQCI
jgi:hypothetical protein